MVSHLNERPRVSRRLAWLCCTSLTAAACTWTFASNIFITAQAQTALPTGGNVVSGQATIGIPSGNALIVNQSSSRAIIDWNSFSVGQNASVNFVQPNASSAILNRVTGSTSSAIAGQVTGNGQVFLINPNGIAITSSGAVQVGGGFVASTLDIANASFNDGNLNFAGNGASAGVSNAGTITSASGGFVGLIGGTVSNAGTINVPLGKVGLGSGEQATINPTGDGFLQVAFPTGATAADGRALIDIAGNIKAKGGTIAITAATAQQAVRDAVNVSGRLSARSVSGSNGNILLDGGAGGNVAVSGTLSAKGGKREKGGAVVVAGNSVNLTSTARLNASGTDGGNILVGGDMRGGADPSAKLVPGFVRNAQTAIIQSGAFIKADGKTGSGGNVVVWSDNFTDFRGNISAKGSGNGNGGLAEVSSHGVLNYQGRSDLSAANGVFGTLLLDPYNVTISNSSNSNISGGSPFTPNGDDSNLSINTLENALNFANVTVNTGSSGSQAGDITLVDSINWFSGTSLTLTAARDVIINGSVSTYGNGGLNLNGGRNVVVNSSLSGVFFGSLSVTMTAGTGSVAINGASINTDGQNLSISAPSAGGDGVLLSNADLNVGSGTGTITGAASSSGAGLTFSGSSTLSSSGGGLWTLNGSSDTGSGVYLANAATIASSGSTAITGSSNSGSSVYFTGLNTVSKTSGNLSVTGTTSSYRGINFLGSNYLYNTGSGTFNVSGTTSSTNINNGGVALNAGSTLSTSGNVSITGTSTANTPGIGIDDSTIAVASGNLSLAGTSDSGAGLSFYAGNALNNSGAGTISVSGTSNSGIGIGFYPNATVSSYGNLIMQGTSPTSDLSGAGFLFAGNNSFTANSGNVSISGTDNGTTGSSGFSGSGINFDGSTSITNAGVGTFALVGNSNSGSGVKFNPGSGLTTTGNVSVGGNTNSWLGIYLTGSNALTASSGNLAISGTSSSNSGIFFSGASSVYTNGGGGSLSFTGTSSSYRGIDFFDSSSMTFAGGITVSGSSTSNTGTNFQRNAISVSSGNLTINGTSSSGSGVRFGTPATTTIANNGAGAVTVAGVSNGGYGTLVSTGNSVTTSGNTTLSGSSTSNNGFYLDSNGVLTSSSGDLTVSGSSSSVGLELRGASSVTNSGSGRLTLNGTGGANLNSAVSSTGGPLVISGSGNINQSGGTITANDVLLSGASGNFNLDTASNQIGTIAANAASIFLADSTSLSTGTVQGTSGVTTTGNLSLITAGDLTIASGATISGANPVLAATGAFINSAGSNAVTATSGRWLIYSNTPAGNTFGGLDSGNAAIWNATYASLPPGSVTATGKRYLFGYQPTLTFTSTNASKTYGDDATSDVASRYVVSGIEPGVANAYLADTASGVFSGTPAVTSAGAPPSASVAGSPYSIAVAAGSLVSLANYALAYVSSGQLTINPAPLDVTALGGSSNYGTSPPNPGLSASGLKNGETTSVLTGIRNSFGITGSTDVGRYATDVTGSLTNTNYTVANRTSGSWDVIPLRGSLNGTPNTGAPPNLPSGINSNANNKNTNALDSLANSSGAVNAENRAAVNSSARSRPQGAAGGVSFPGTLGNSVLPDMSTAPVVALPSVVAAANASMASAPNPGCGEGNAGVSGAGAGNGQSGGCLAAPAPPKEQGFIDFALSKLNRSALFESIDREFSDIQSSNDAVPAALTQVIAGTSVAVTAGVIGWLLRGGALLTALLSSMPLWREFDPLTVVMRTKRRDEEEQPPSEVDLMFDGARKLKVAMRGHTS